MKKKITRGSTKARKSTAKVKLSMRKLRSLGSDELKWAAGGLSYGSGGTDSYDTGWTFTRKKR